MPYGNPRISVLVIDDDYEDQLLAWDLLAGAEHARFEYSALTRAAEAYEKLVSNSFDIYLVDYMLNGSDGIELVTRAMLGGCVRPIIMLTGQADFEIARRALKAGAGDYLVKGKFSSGDLERAIRYAIERKNLELELRKLNQELELRVAERTADLVVVNRELEGFTHSVSHDLRTPLRAIMSTSMILLEDHFDELSPSALDLLRRQSKVARRLGQLMDDLLALSRVARIEPLFRPVDLSALLKQSLQDRGTPVEAEIEPNIVVRGDERLLQLAILNLLDNSFKFGQPGEVVRLEFFRQGDEVVYRAHGIGFDQRFIEKIWLPFQRLVSDDEYVGTGIGLANVKRIIERQGGHIRAEGVLGEGATFWIALPPG
jgi:signal transduction histidine kinase